MFVLCKNACTRELLLNKEMGYLIVYETQVCILQWISPFEQAMEMLEGISVTPWSCPLNIVEPYSGRWASSTVFEVQFSSMHSHLYSSLRWFNRLKTWGSAISQQKCLKWLSEIGVTTLFIYLIYMYMHATRSVWRSEGNLWEFLLSFHHVGLGNFSKSRV